MTDDGDDPFDSFESPDDEDDPFEDLSGPDEEGDPGTDDPAPAGPDESSPPGRLPDDPFDRGNGSAADANGSADGVGPGNGDGPGNGEETDIQASPEPTDDPFAEFSTTPREDDDPFSAFESAGVDEIDPDAVWADLERGGEGPGDGERTYAEVSKHRFCEGCEHFSGPPEIRCTYDGAAIVEFLDVETVRLVNCPIVAEQRALERGGVGPDESD